MTTLLQGSPSQQIPDTESRKEAAGLADGASWVQHSLLQVRRVLVTDCTTVTMSVHVIMAAFATQRPDTTWSKKAPNIGPLCNFADP